MAYVVLNIVKFEFGICFVFRASDFIGFESVAHKRFISAVFPGPRACPELQPLAPNHPQRQSTYRWRRFP